MFKPLVLGNVTLPINVSYAPLAGFTDIPMRMVCSLFSPGLMFCEMVKMEALIRSDIETFRMLGYTANMRPMGAQLCGANPLIAGASAKILEDLGFDVIDLNCGCPVDKVTKDGSGSALLKTPLRIGEILSNMVAAVKIPVTVKIRAGWNEDNLVFKEVVRIAELAGAKAITLHARTQAQGYTGLANREWIKQAKEQATSIKVIGNGDIFSAQDALSMLQETGCDGVLVARGMLGQPWIADDCRRLSNCQYMARSPEERKEVLLQHVEKTLECVSDVQALIDLRRVTCMYVGKSKDARHFREILAHAQSIDEMIACIKEAPL
jgi:tRNA-dihydrouridine synthase B